MIKAITMVLVMTAKLIFPATDVRAEVLINKVSVVNIESSWKLLTDRATIILPRNISKEYKEYLKKYFRRGDKVIIHLGYNESSNVEFTGYITNVSTDFPIKIKCEDNMWVLKQTPVNTSIQNATLKNLLNEITPKRFQVDALEVDLGHVRFSRMTLSNVLEKLNEVYGLYSYFKGDTLVCGRIYADDENLQDVVYKLERNVISNDLEYQSADEVNIKVRAISTLKDGKKIEVTVGDDDGEERQLSYYGISDKSKLKKLAEIDLKKYKVDRLSGGITTFGNPFIQHGQKANISSDKYSEQDEKYYSESVNVNWSSKGFRRVIKLGEKV